MMYEEDDIHDDDSDMDDDMMILPILSSKESAAFRRRRFGEMGLRSPGPWFMRIWLYSHNRRMRGERGQSDILLLFPRSHARMMRLCASVRHSPSPQTGEFRHATIQYPQRLHCS